MKKENKRKKEKKTRVLFEHDELATTQLLAFSPWHTNPYLITFFSCQVIIVSSNHALLLVTIPYIKPETICAES